MKKKNIITLLSIIMIFLMNINIYSWEVYDRIIATVNEAPIIESEIMSKFNRLLKVKKIPKKKRPYKMSRLLDMSIETALIIETAASESIIVSDEKVDNHIKKIMTRMNINSLKKFRKKIESKEKIPFDEYREELRRTLMTQDVISIAIGVSPPSSKEAKEYYKKNKKKVGFEVNIQHILIKLKKDTFSENKKVNKEINALYKKIRKGERFGDIAREFSEDPFSKNNKGKLGWVALSNIAREDLIYANNIYKKFIIDKAKIGIIKSGKGYHIVKLNGKRPTSFEAARDEIFNVLYQQKQAEQFKKWVYQKRLESDIKIYMEDYIKERRNL